jgi:alcohol dehydrogenase
MFSHEAFKLCVKALPEILLNPTDLEARGRMQLGAAFAGLAIENSMLGAAHAAANPLTAHYGIVHGQAVGLMLPAVVRFNGEDPAARQAYAELASAPEIASVSGDGHDHAWLALIDRLEVLLDLTGLKSSLEKFGVKSEMSPKLANEASRQWTASFNPRTVSKQDFVKLYDAAFQPGARAVHHH